MSFDFDLALKVSGPLVGGLITKLVSDFIERRPKVVCFYQSSAGVTMKAVENAPPVRVHFHSIVVANQGREPAKNVRLGHADLPNFEIAPIVEHEVRELVGGLKEILIPSLAPKEQILVSYAYFPPLTYDKINTYVKSDSGFARVLRVLPTPQLPNWLNFLVWILVACGVGAIAYVLISLVIR